MILLRIIISVLGIVGIAGVAPAGASNGKPMLQAEPDYPIGFGYKVSWFAVHTSDAKAVGKALGLTDLQPANWRSGIAAAYDGTELRAKVVKVFVSPPVEGWTFVVGAGLPYPADVSSRAGEQQIGLAFRSNFLNLATRFDDVQFFGTYRVLGFDAWARARNGRVERIFSFSDGEVLANEGVQTPEEAQLGFLNLERRSPGQATAFIFEQASARDKNGGKQLRNPIPDEQDTVALAEAWSIDPTQLEKKVQPKGIGFVGFLPRRASR